MAKLRALEQGLNCATFRRFIPTTERSTQRREPHVKRCCKNILNSGGKCHQAEQSGNKKPAEGAQGA